VAIIPREEVTLYLSTTQLVLIRSPRDPVRLICRNSYIMMACSEKNEFFVRTLSAVI
jgi:hypothetical protein